MFLKSVTMSGFKSFRKRAELPISNRTTVLIGPNDHGKTNALLALEKLNPDKAFEATEVNDRVDGAETASIRYKFVLSESEVTELLIAAQEDIGSLVRAGAAVTEPTALPPLVDAEAVELFKSWMLDLSGNHEIELVRQPGKSLEGSLKEIPEQFRAAYSSRLLKTIPKAVLFSAETLRQLPDTVDLPSLEKNEVMQGVFRLAGIWSHRQRLLSGNTRKNQDDLRNASTELTRRIRENWTQGRDLEFYLEYVGNNIRLTVKDTASSVTAIGERSEGLTAYFAMRMLLVARTEAAQPNGYIFMFDEPGLNLHPKGQVDLQNVFEDIARANQIVYSTHSVFLINKNYPDRNHLIFKNQEGSNIDNKPFVGGWAKVKEHLGLYLSANFLFSDAVLLAEGATDEIYVPLIVQGLIEKGRFDGDLNAFAIHSGLNESEMISSARNYIHEGRRVAVLLDGDDEGQKRKKKFEAWSKRSNRECPVVILSEFTAPECSIEDLLEPTIFVEAVTLACREAIEADLLKPKVASWDTDLKAQISVKNGISLGKRVEQALVELFGDTISDVWIARKYGEILRSERPPADAALPSYWANESLLGLATRIWESLDLAKRGDLARIPFASAE
jgi:hypothetical protein